MSLSTTPFSETGEDCWSEWLSEAGCGNWILINLIRKWEGIILSWCSKGEWFVLFLNIREGQRASLKVVFLFQKMYYLWRVDPSQQPNIHPASQSSVGRWGENKRRVTVGWEGKHHKHVCVPCSCFSFPWVFVAGHDVIWYRAALPLKHEFK